MSGVIAIAAYRPHPGQEAALAALLATHVPTLRGAALVTTRPSILAKSKDGAVIEIFEWESERAKELAHADDVVRALWERLDEISESVSLAELPEAGELFAAFSPLDTTD